MPLSRPYVASAGRGTPTKRAAGRVASLAGAVRVSGASRVAFVAAPASAGQGAGRGAMLRQLRRVGYTQPIPPTCLRRRGKTEAANTEVFR